jgi:Domain of unknown function (DUF4129)
MNADRASVLPAALAAVAESAVLYLLVHDIAMNEGRVVAGPMMHFWAFVAVFGAGVAVATGLRKSSLLPAGVGLTAGALGLAQGTWWGTGDVIAVGTSVLLWLAVGVRIITLALRDWREPIGTSFGVGAVALLAEIFLMGGFAEGSSVLPLAVPQFFLASMASRAASFRLSTEPASTAEGKRRGGAISRGGVASRVGMGLVAIAVLGTLLAAAAGLGGHHGGLQLLGKGILAVVIPIVAYVLAPVLKLLVDAAAWLVGFLHIDLSGLRRIAENINRFRAHPPQATSPSGGPLGRVLALLFLLALGYLLIRTLRLRWSWFTPRGGSGARTSEAIPMSVLSPTRRRKRTRLRQELPADTVRRWYAEALLALEGLGLAKVPSRTPGEYLRDVTVAFPECAAGFTALTRAYEDVRYGSMRFNTERLERLEANRQLAMTALSRAHRLRAEEEQS